MQRHGKWSLALRTLCALMIVMSALTQGMSQPFTYQGFLKESGNPANGAYDFRFRLWNAPSGGVQVGSDLFVNDLTVQNGLFTTELDFGSVWDGSARYLEIAVRPGASTGGYQELLPRVKITRAPYSQYAFTTPWSGISGMPAGFADGIDNDTTYSAGAGLQLAGTTFSIATGGVATSMLADLSVTTVKIANGAVTDAKLSNTGVAAGTYGSATQVAQFTVNAQGRITSASNVTISGVSPGGAAGGDLSGSYPNPTVAKLQGRPVATTAPTTGQVLKWDGTAWSPDTDLRDAFWQASGSNIFYNAGNVGIGTSSPESRLHVLAGSAGTVTADANSVLTIEHSARAYLSLLTPDNTERGILFGQPSSNVAGGIIYNSTATPNGLQFRTNGNTTRMVIDGSGNVGIGITNPSYALHVRTNSGNRAIYGLHTATSGTSYGVYGRSDSPDGTGVFGYASATSGLTYGGWFQSDSADGTGVYGIAAATSGTTYGGWFQSDSTSGTGVFGYASATSGITYGGWFESASPNGRGVYGYASASSGTNYGVYGKTNSSSGYAGYFEGKVHVNGTLSKSAGSFKIDHPLDPENKYLVHSFVESPDMMNIYNGNVTTDAQSYAVVQLPDYFETLNRDFRYQLTVIDNSDDFVQAKVVRKIQNNRFVIRTSKPFVEVSWQVTGIRQDPYAEKYRIQVEEEKLPEHRGKYLHPELYGQPKEMGIHYRPEPEQPNEVEKPR